MHSTTSYPSSKNKFVFQSFQVSQSPGSLPRDFSVKSMANTFSLPLHCNLLQPVSPFDLMGHKWCFTDCMLHIDTVYLESKDRLL